MTDAPQSQTPEPVPDGDEQSNSTPSGPPIPPTDGVGLAESSRSVRPYWLLRLLMLVPLGLSAYLLWFSLSGKAVPGCGPGESCANVLSSKWAYWLGLPVSASAIGVYLIMLAATFAVDRRRSVRSQRWGWSVLVLLALLVLGAALWFMSLQLFYLKSICYYCSVAHVGGIVVAVIVIILTPISKGAPRVSIVESTHSEPKSELPAPPFESPVSSAAEPAGALRPGSVLAAAVAATVLLGAMFTLQMQSRQPMPPQWILGSADHDSGPGADRYLVVLNGIYIRPADWPMLGSPNADHVLVYLFDYTCSHCRRLHRHLEEALVRYGDQLSVMCLPAPLSHHCSDFYKTTSPQRKDSCELASIAMSVWRSDRSAYGQFDHAFMDDAKEPSVAIAREIADPLVGAEKLDKLIKSESVRGQILAGGRINARASQIFGSRSLPKLIWVGGGIPGAYDESSDLFEKLENDLEIKPLAPGDAYQASRPLAPILLAGGVASIVLLAGFLIAFFKSS